MGRIQTVQRVAVAHQKEQLYYLEKEKLMSVCKSLGCIYPTNKKEDFCMVCLRQQELIRLQIVSPIPFVKEPTDSSPQKAPTESMSEKYPKYYKPVGELTEIDVYAIHHLFQIQDCSGAIQHASKKLLLSGSRTGGKSQFKDIKEARDTLTRWLQLNPEN